MSGLPEDSHSLSSWPKAVGFRNHVPGVGEHCAENQWLREMPTLSLCPL